MSETRKLAAIVVADIVGYSRLTGEDEEGTVARLRTLRAEFIDPTIASHGGRLVKRTGDGAVVEFRSVVEAVRSALDVQQGLAAHNAGLPADRRIEARVGVHLGDVIEEADGDLMGDGVNVAARLQSISAPGGICLSEDADRQVRDKLRETFVDLGEKSLKNIARPMRVYALSIGGARPAIPSASAFPESRGRRPVGKAITAAVVVVFESLARLVGALAEKASDGARPAIETAAGDVPSLAQRRRDRRLRRAIILAAIIALLAARECRDHRATAPPPAPPHPAAVDDRLEARG